jgi:hypothetical protein
LGPTKILQGPSLLLKIENFPPSLLPLKKVTFEAPSFLGTSEPPSLLILMTGISEAPSLLLLLTKGNLQPPSPLLKRGTSGTLGAPALLPKKGNLEAPFPLAYLTSHHVT